MMYALFGKDCSTNLEFISTRIKVSDNSYTVGVESFKDMLIKNGVPTRKISYIKRGSLDNLGSRLDSLLRVDYVIILPIKGQMTNIELAMAKEKQIPVQEF